MKRIIIVEDDKTICRELFDLLSNSGYEAVILEKFDNSKNDILMANPDLILMDINIPGLSGELLLKEIRKESDVPVIMVTSRTGEIDEALSITYGADDYVTKPYSPTILLLRIQNIFKRMEQKTDKLFYGEIEVRPGKGILSKKDKETWLTKNEMIIFCYLLNNQNRIVTRDELMTELWNNEEYINDNALTVNISRLRNKLADFGCKDAIETRRGQGYLLL